MAVVSGLYTWLYWLYAAYTFSLSDVRSEGRISHTEKEARTEKIKDTNLEFQWASDKRIRAQIQYFLMPAAQTVG